MSRFSRVCPPRLTSRLIDALLDADPAEINDYDEIDSVRCVYPGTVNVFAGGGREITPGVIDGETRAWYLYGNCALLAIELHRMTSWPLIMLATERKTKPSLNDTPMVHVLVRRPDGQLLDIEGVRTENGALDVWRRSFPDIHVRGMRDEKELTDIIGSDFDMYSPLERELTRDFAQRLLDGQR